MSDYLPQEVLFDIFHRLPNSSIGRCMCVCKYWLSLIKNPFFVSSHLPSKKLPLFLLKLCSKHSLTVHYSLHFNNQQFGKYKRLGLPFNYDNRSFSAVGSSNGLVCLMHNLYTYNYTFVLWNPLIRKSFTLPKPNVTFESHGAFEAFVGFGFDSCSKDYKVVRVVRLLEYDKESEEDEELAIEVEIFSLNKNSWINITHKAPQYGIVERGSQAFVNGTVHWIATQRGRTGESNNLVLGLDLGNENFHELKLPQCVANENPMFCSVFKYMDSTVAVVKRNYLHFSNSDIWVMKRYGVTESWTKLLTVGIYNGGVPKALGFRRNGDVLFELFHGEIVSINPETLLIEELRIHTASGYCYIDDFMESLALLDRDEPSGRSLQEKAM